MAKARSRTSRNKKSSDLTKEDLIEEIVETEIEFVCPKRGKIKQKVKVKRLKSIKMNVVQPVSTSDKLLSIVENQDTSVDSTDEQTNDSVLNYVLPDFTL